MFSRITMSDEMIAVGRTQANSYYLYIALLTFALILLRGTKLMNMYYIYYLSHFILFI